MMRRSHEGEFTIWNYEKFYAVGVYGRLDRSLEEVCDLFKGDNSFEFAEPREEPRRTFLAGVHHKPIIDITLARGDNGESSIINYGVDNKEKVIEVTRRVIQQSGLTPSRPTLDFIATIDQEIDIHQMTYQGCVEISRASGLNLGQAFGLVVYHSFLTNYKGISIQKAGKIATEKIGLPNINF